MSQENQGKLVRWCVTPRTAASVLLGVVVVLAAAHAITKILWGVIFPQYNLNYYHYIYGARLFFDIARGGNLPGYFSTLIKLLAAVLTLTIAASERQRGHRDWGYWAVLSVGFVGLSLDESAKVHDLMVSHLLNLVWGEAGWARYGWFVVYIPVVAIAAVAFLPFLNRLKNAHRTWFVAGGLVFLTGGLGVELIESSLDQHGVNRRWIDVTLFVEETLEMVGVVILNYAFMKYWADHEIGLCVYSTSSS